jgi:hypothetical protein
MVVCIVVHWLQLFSGVFAAIAAVAWFWLPAAQGSLSKAGETQSPRALQLWSRLVRSSKHSCRRVGMHSRGTAASGASAAERAALVRLIRQALGITVLFAALGGCQAVVSPQPGWDPYASGVGPMPHGSRVLGDQ